MDYKITKEQVRSAYENKEELKKLFPDAFALEVGRWYVKDKTIACYKGNNRCYGFYNGCWSDSYFMYSSEYPRLATQIEIKIALLEEAERRGLTKGVKIKAPEPNKDGISKGTIEFKISYDNGTLFSSGLWIFKNGQWAEIISEPIELTLEDIAEKFGVSAEEIKIKK